MSKAHAIELGGIELIPDLSGALYVPSHETLIISDLHLEQGTSLARRGIHVPPYDTAITLALLHNVVGHIKPKRLVFLGDTFHDGEAEQRLDESHIVRLQDLTRNIETFWICGNHDPEAPEIIGGKGAEMIMLGSIALRHEPKLHLEEGPEIAGHLHPGCGVNQRGRRIYGKCFIGDDSRLIMPAFGAYTGGLNITSKAFTGLFNKKTAQATMIGRAALHRFPVAKLNLP